MATSTSVDKTVDDLLTCTICLETLKVPKYLPCLHTFCEKCIHTYITSSEKEDKSTGFKCPICRRLVSFEEKEGNPETWSKQLPGNHFVLSLLNRNAIIKSEKPCISCERNGISDKAISWCIVCEEAYCKTCGNCHKSLKVTLQHSMIPLKDIKESNIDSCISGVVVCTEHPEKTIEIYCNDHSKSCCTVCATVHHRKCEHVVTIDKAVYGVKESSKAIELLTKLKDTSVKLSEILKTRKENVSRFEKETNAVLAEISKFRESVNKHLDGIEDKLRNEMTSTQKTIGLKLNDDVTELSSLKSTVDNWRDMFEACLSKGSEIQCLVNLDELLEKVPRMNDDISKLLREIKDISVSFTPEDLVHNMASIGHIKTTETIPHSLIDKEEKTKVNFQTGKIRVLFTIDVGTVKSTRESDGFRFLSGIFFNDNVIVTDNVNSRIVMYDDQGVQKKELKMDHQPTDITKVNDLTVAVATSSTKVYLVDPKLMTLSRIFTMEVNARRISYVGDEYVVIYSDTISWIDPTTGKQIRDLKTGYHHTKFASSSCKGEIIYNDSVSSVKCVSTKGNNFTYKSDQLNKPRSYDTDCDGNIYIVGHASKNIHQLTSDGKCIRIIPVSDFSTIIHHPWVLRFKDNNNIFMLTFYHTGNVLVCEID